MPFRSATVRAIATLQGALRRFPKLAAGFPATIRPLGSCDWASTHRQRDGELPAELREALDADPEIAAAFAAQSAQNRFAMAFRVANLKRPASRAARVAQYVEMLKRGETLH